MQKPALPKIKTGMDTMDPGCSRPTGLHIHQNDMNNGTDMPRHGPPLRVLGSSLVLLLLCTLSRCSAGNTGHSSGNLGQFPAIVMADGQQFAPEVLYNSGLGLKRALCADPSCERVAAREQMVCSGQLVASSAYVKNGVPSIAFAVREVSSSSSAYAVACTDLRCESYHVNKLDSSDVGYAITTVLNANNLPTSAYYDKADSRLVVATCTTASCSNVHLAYPASIGAFFGEIGTISMVIAASGFPIISFQKWDADAAVGQLKLAVCKDSMCGNSSLVLVDDHAAQYSSLVIRNSIPIVAYVDSTYTSLRIAYCEQSTCETNLTIVDVDVPATSNDHLITYPVLRIGPYGFPTIAFFLGSSLRVLRCKSLYCADVQPTFEIALVDFESDWITSGMQISMELDEYGHPFIAYSVLHVNSTSSKISVAKCSDLACFFVSKSTLDDKETVPSSQLQFKLVTFIVFEIIMLLLVFAVIFSGKSYKNRASIVNDFALMPFTSRVVLHYHQRQRLHLVLLITLFASLIAAVPWMAYFGLDMAAYAAIFVAAALSLVSMIFVWFALQRATLRMLFGSALSVVLALLLLPLAFTYNFNVVSSLCQTNPPNIPQNISAAGLALLVLTQVMALYICARAYTAIQLATPASASVLDDDDAANGY